MLPASLGVGVGAGAAAPPDPDLAAVAALAFARSTSVSNFAEKLATQESEDEEEVAAATAATVAAELDKDGHRSDSSHRPRHGQPAGPPSQYFQRVIITRDIDEVSEEQKEVCSRLLWACVLRDKYDPDRRVRVGTRYWGDIDPEKFALHAARAQQQREQQRDTEQAETDQPRLPRRPLERSPSASDPAHHIQASFSQPQARPPPPFTPFDDATRRDVAPAGKEFYGTAVIQGVYYVVRAGCRTPADSLTPDLPTLAEFYSDLAEVMATTHDAACKTACFTRLSLLDARYNLHILLNSERESSQLKAVPHRDFYNVRKVDTHIHHSAIMTQKHLLRFIKHKLRHCPDEIVAQRDGRYLTLREIFESLNLTPHDLSIDSLNMHANETTFHRFDRFNQKYNPVGESRLREVFLKSDNVLRGRYLAEITRQVFDDIEASKYVCVEPRISVYGRRADEWTKLAQWYCDNRLASPNVRWMIQIPRLYEVYRKAGFLRNFQELIDNIFAPLFEVSLDPATDPKLDTFLRQVVGFDCVDDESKLEHTESSLLHPAEWTGEENPPYTYWSYFVYANLRSLNALRQKRGMTTFSFRPHSGEAGGVEHLAATFLTAESINHGIMLRKSPVLQYLYYLKQIGLAVSPLSNNRLFLAYQSNPFPLFHARGLNVSLSTDDPLLLHITSSPLAEEYSVAQQVWRLTPTDCCEIARNSVLQSGFEFPWKSHFLGSANFWENDVRYTNVPPIRVAFRVETLEGEWAYMRDSANA